MQERTQFFITLAVTALLLSCCVLLYFSCQDLHRKETLASQNAREANAVVGRYFKFDSVILGTSLSENFKCSEFDKITDGYSMKMTTAGGHISEIVFMAEYAFKHQQIKNVLLDIFIGSYILSEAPSQLPVELYNDSMEYIDHLGESVKLRTILKYFKSIKRRKKENGFDRDGLYSWARAYPCGMTPFVKYLFEKEDEMKKHAAVMKNYDASIVKKNIQNYLIPLIKKHQDVTFYVYLPPYSMVEFSTFFKVHKIFRKEFMDALLEFPNVRFYDFQSAESVICNFSNYKDLYHYSESISRWLLSEMKVNNYLVTRENKFSFEQNFENVVKKFDLEKGLQQLRQHYLKQLDRMRTETGKAM